MNLLVSMLIFNQKMAEVLESSPATVCFFIFSWNQEVCKMEVLFQEKCYVDSSYSEEKTCFILFHDLNLSSILFHEPKNKL